MPPFNTLGISGALTPVYLSCVFTTCGLATIPSPSGFRVITAGTWARVINPSPCCNLARSVSSMVKVRGIKLGHVPVPAGTLPHIPGYFTLPLQCPHIDWEHSKPAEIEGTSCELAVVMCYPTSARTKGKGFSPSHRICICLYLRLLSVVLDVLVQNWAGLLRRRQGVGHSLLASS